MRAQKVIYCGSRVNIELKALIYRIKKNAIGVLFQMCVNERMWFRSVTSNSPKLTQLVDESVLFLLSGWHAVVALALIALS